MFDEFARHQRVTIISLPVKLWVLGPVTEFRLRKVGRAVFMESFTVKLSAKGSLRDSFFVQWQLLKILRTYWGLISLTLIAKRTHNITLYYKTQLLSNLRIGRVKRDIVERDLVFYSDFSWLDVFARQANKTYVTWSRRYALRKRKRTKERERERTRKERIRAKRAPRDIAFRYSLILFVEQSLSLGCRNTVYPGSGPIYFNRRTNRP